MRIGKKHIIFEIFCRRKRSHGKDSKKLTQIYQMIKLSFFQGLTASLLNLVEDSLETAIYGRKLANRLNS